MNYFDIKYLRKNIERLKLEIEVINARLTKITPVLSDMPKPQTLQESIDILVEEKLRLQEMLQRMKEDLRIGLNSIPNTQTGRMVELRAIHGYSYRLIASRILDDPTKECAVKKRIYRFSW